MIYTIGIILGPALIIYGMLLFTRDQKPAHRDFHYNYIRDMYEYNNDSDDCLRDSDNSSNIETNLNAPQPDEKAS